MEDSTLPGMVALMGVVVAMAPGIQQVLSWIRNALDPQMKLPSWNWIGLSVVIGVAITLFFDVNVDVIPARGPEWFKQVVVGLTAGGLASGFHEIKGVVKAKRLELEEKSSATTQPV